MTVEDGPNAKAEKADKVPYVRGQHYTQKCGAVTHEGHMRTLLAADDMVDKILSTLQATGELAHTLVVFTSDNGWTWDEHGLTSKALPYTEDVKVPFIVRWDGVFPAGAVDSRPVGGEDFLPTYLDAAGFRPPEVRYALDGRSFLPGRPARDVKYLEFGPVGRPKPKGYLGHRGVPTWRRCGQRRGSTSSTTKPTTRPSSSGSTTTWARTPGRSTTSWSTRTPATIPM